MTDGKIVKLGNSPSLASWKRISLGEISTENLWALRTSCGVPRKQLRGPSNFGGAHKTGSESGGRERKLKFTAKVYDRK